MSTSKIVTPLDADGFPMRNICGSWYSMGRRGTHGDDDEEIVVPRIFTGVQSAKFADANAVDMDYLGHAVALSPDWAVVGATGADDNGSSSGAVHVYKRADEEWLEYGKLVAPNNKAGDKFGSCLAIHGNYILVGSPNSDDGGESSGSVDVFELSNGVWNHHTHITATDGTAGDYFGSSVAVTDDYLAIGAKYNAANGTKAGAAYVYRLVDGVWKKQTKLLASDGADNANFGVSVDIDGDKIIIGASGHTENWVATGAAYLFTLEDGIWEEHSKILPPDGAAQDMFGFSVALSDKYLVIGSYLDDDSGTSSGSVYVYNCTEDGPVYSDKLTPPSGFSGSYFGYCVAVAGDIIGVGEYGDSSVATWAGSIVVYRNEDGVWTKVGKLTANDGASMDRFGYSIAVADARVIIGAYAKTTTATSGGAAYIFI